MKRKKHNHPGSGYNQPITQMIRVMKLIALLVIVFVHVKAEGWSQTVTLHMDKKPILEVLNEIARQTKINFTFNQKVAMVSRPVTIHLEKGTVKEAMDKCVEGQPLAYEIKADKNIIIFIPTSTNFTAIHDNAKDTAHELVITGKIMNEKGSGLQGASIMVRNSNKGTQTNSLGDFTLKGLDDDILVISYTGYSSQQFKVSGRNSIQVYLQPALTELDRVVVQGYGVTTQRFATGNIVTVTADEIGRQPVVNALQAIQGRVAGLTITQTSGYASAPFKVELRGRSVISGELPSEPLFIVDGVPLTILETGRGNYESGSFGFTQNNLTGPANGQSPFFSISPDDIESITVLKDADATAIYGSRGGRGVILINTKRGKPGQVRVEANLYTGSSFVVTYIDMLNTQEYIEMRKEAFKNSNIPLDPSYAYDFLVWDSTRYTDWQKFYWGKAGHNTNVELNISGGEKNSTFRISASYNKWTALNTISGADERASLQYNFGHKSTNRRLDIQLTGLYSFTKSNNVSLGGNSTLAPTAPPVFDEIGRLNYNGYSPVPNEYPFGNIFQPYIAKTNFLNTTLKIEYIILKGLKFASSFGHSFNKVSQATKIPIASQNPALSNLTGQATFGNSNGTRNIIEPTLEYSNKIGGGTLTYILGGTYQTVNQEGNTIIGTGYVNDNLLNSIANAPIKDASDNLGQYKYVALFTRLGYNFKEKYLINLSGRRDGSSRFGPGRQFGNFGAIGIGWIFSEEPFVQNSLKFVSFGKLRASYGIVGSDLIGDYNHLTQWSASERYWNENTYYPIRHANPELQWQEDKKLELGLHFGFLKDRITAGISWYQNRSGNQLLSFSLPTATGFSAVYANFPATVQNSGWEPTLNIKIIQNKIWELSSNFQLGINKNKLIEYVGIETSPYADTYQIGKSLSIKKLLIYKNVDPISGEYTFDDRNKDGQISLSGDNDDRMFYDLTPKFEGGADITLQYKNWQLNVFFNFRKQEGLNAIYGGGAPGGMANQSKEVLKRWQKPGDISNFSRFTVFPVNSDAFFLSSTGRYTDASYIRLSNLSVAYNLPATLQKKLKLTGCKIYARGQNLLLITNYKGGDPEVQRFGVMPPLTSIVGGIQLSF